MKKIAKYVMPALTAVLLLSLAACGSSFEYDKDAADKRAREVTDVLVAQDYDAIVALFREDLQSLTTAEDFKAAWDPYLQDAGAFVEIKGVSTAGQRIRPTSSILSRPSAASMKMRRVRIRSYSTRI
jgi:hypothetical protein